MGVTATEMRKTGSVLEELTNLGWGTDKQTIVKQLARAVIKDVSQVYAVRRKSAETRLSVCLHNRYPCGHFPLTSGFNMYPPFPM